METSRNLSGKRNRAIVDIGVNSDELQGNQERSYRAGNPHLTFGADKEVAKEGAQWRRPELKARWGAAHASAREGVDAAMPEWIVEECNRVLVQGLTEGGEKLHVGTGECCQGAGTLSVEEARGMSASERPRPHEVYVRRSLGARLGNG